MQDSPLISVIVPIYKVEPYLRRCVDSIVNQTYTNLEIILVDDGSPDGCPAICDEYAQKDNRIIVIHKENGGLSDARNTGLDICKGEYITFVDSDDWVDINYINAFVDIIKAEEKYDFIAANHIKCNKQKMVPSVFSYNKKILQKQNILNEYCQLGIIPICAWNKLYSKDFINKNKLLFKKHLLFEDQLWGIQCASKAEKIRLIPEAHYFYNIRQESIMNSSEISIDKRIASWMTILQESKDILNNSTVPPRKKNFFLLHKIEETLSVSLCNFKTFKRAYLNIQNSLHKKPIFYWYKTASTIKKLPFLFLYIASPTITQFLLYSHIKQRKKV